MEELSITLICKQENSTKVPHILEEIKKEYENFNFKIKETYSFAPAFDEVAIKVILCFVTALTPLIIKAIFRKLYEDDIKIEYEDRYKIAKRMLADKGPLICEQIED